MSQIRTVSSHRGADERGAMLVLLAVVMVGMLALAGLVIDGGRAYADHREVQNSADVAALAGTGALNGILFSSDGHEKDVYDTVQASITANGTNGAFECHLIDEAKNDLGLCPTTNTADGTGLPEAAVGVAVKASDSQGTSFMKVVGIGSFSADATAKAQVQALLGGTAPFMLCGTDVDPGGLNPAGTPPLLIADPAESPAWVINSAAVGHEYLIHSDHVPDCGGGSSGFKGLVDEQQTFQLSAWWETKSGTTAGPVRQMLAGPNACQGEVTDGCRLILPLCSLSNGETGTNFEMWCVRMGVFEISFSDSNTHRAIFRGGASLVTTGQGGGKPVLNEARLIKLSE